MRCPRRRQKLAFNHRKMAASQPCFPPHELLPQNHVAPRNPACSLFPSATQRQRRRQRSQIGLMVQPSPLLCTWGVHLATAFVASLSVTERDSGGSCRAVQKSSFGSLVVPAVPGYVASSYYATIIIPVSTSCATSAVTGSGSLSIGGATVSFSNAIWMGFARNIPRHRRPPTARRTALPLASAPSCTSFGTCLARAIIRMRTSAHRRAPTRPMSSRAPRTNTATNTRSLAARTAGLNARLRYHFGWLGASNITFITLRGTALARGDQRRDGRRRRCAASGGLPCKRPLARVAIRDGHAGVRQCGARAQSRPLCPPVEYHDRCRPELVFRPHSYQLAVE